MNNYDTWKTTNSSLEAAELIRYGVENMETEEIICTLENNYKHDRDFLLSCTPLELVDMLVDHLLS